jgi:hypothetical protein
MALRRWRVKEYHDGRLVKVHRFFTLNKALKFAQFVRGGR